MLIQGNISRIAESKTTPLASIESDFFARSFTIPEEETVQGTPQPVANPLAEWKTTINRELMKGTPSSEILKTLGRFIEDSPQKDEILAYLKKYEGLVGTVFIDSSVVEGGFPMALIPQRYRPYNTFAINCNTYNTVSKRSIEGGLGGTIESFLKSAEGVKEETEDVCVITGLPVLREGMFTPEVVSRIMAKLGLEGSTLPELRSAMLEKVVNIYNERKQPVETVEADLNYGLRAPSLEIPESEGGPVFRAASFQIGQKPELRPEA